MWDILQTHWPPFCNLLPLVLTLAAAKQCQEKWKCLSNNGTMWYSVWKNHYPESVVWESIVQSLKGAVPDMARYMGSTASVTHILQELMVIFSTVALFDVLMQNFYKVMQGNHEKVPSFTMRLEGTLNQTRLQCPGRITNRQLQQHLKDCLFHWICKHIRDSIWYLYSNPMTTYSQLMIAAHKADSENEEA